MCFVQSLKQQQGGNDSFGVHCPTKTAPLECDIKRGRSLDVPATWQPGQAKNLASRVISQLSEFALLVSSLTFRLPRPNHRRHPDLPRKCEWWCQPILRVRPCRHRQHSLMRTARVRCAAHYGTITSRTPSGQTNGAYRT